MIRSAIKRSKKLRYSLIALGVAVAFLCVLSVRAQASVGETQPLFVALTR
jgi:hypothetical protein